LKLSKTEKILLSLCALIFCAFSYFLYDDSLLFPTEAQTNAKNIGYLNNSQNDVRRKSQESFLWRPAVKSEKIYMRDSIFTGDSSQATLLFDDGSTIELKENTMITLNMTQGQLQLDLRYGDLVTDLKKQTKIEVTVGTEKFDLKPKSSNNSSIQIQRSRTKKIKVKLIQGDALVTNNRNEKINLVKDQALIVQPEKIKAIPSIPTPRQPAINLTTQDKANVLLSQKGETFPLAWEAKDLSEYRVDISSTQDFDKTVYSSPSTSTSHLVVSELNPGWYFWRVIGIENQKEILKSPIRQFFVGYVESPVITSPSLTSDFSFNVPPPIDDFTTQVDLAWTAKPIYESFEWQMANDANFEKVLSEGKISRGPVKSPKLKIGHYYARVRGYMKNTNPGPWSEVRNWAIAVNEKKLSAPELVTKTIKFNPMQAKRTPSSIPSPAVVWKKVPVAKKYLIEVSKNRDFSNKQNFETDSLQWNWTKFKPGQHYFRVYAQESASVKSGPSETGTIEVTLSNPSLNRLTKIYERSPVPGATAPPHNLPLKWTAVPFANKYIVQFDKDPKFKKPLTREISSNSGAVELPDPGQYHVRVQAMDESAKPLTGFSNTESVVYEFRANLAAPSLQEPRHKVNIFLQKDIAPLIWLVWKPDPRAVGYELEVASDPEFKQMITSGKTTTETRFLIKNKLPLSSIYWRVKTIAKEVQDSSNWSETRKFVLMFQKNENFFQ